MMQAIGNSKFGMRLLSVSLAALLTAAPSITEAQDNLAALATPATTNPRRQATPQFTITAQTAATPETPTPAQPAPPPAQPTTEPAQLPTTPQPATPPQPAEDQKTTAANSFSRAELEKLLAPIALYPDALLAQLLPASAYPLQIVQVQRWLEKNADAVAKNDFAAIDNTKWDPAVKALARFPEVVKKLNDNLDWTTDLGDAFVNQPKDVADVIQELRAEAQKAGALKSTPQQSVSSRVQGDRNIIAIEPTEPSVVYVPSYDPDAVYESYPGVAPLLAFGAGIAIGAIWDNNYWDWSTGGVYPPVWPGYPSWRPPYPGWGPGMPVRPTHPIAGGGIINNGNKPWRPGADYRPGRGSKPGIGGNGPSSGGGAGIRPDAGNRLGKSRPAAGPSTLPAMTQRPVNASRRSHVGNASMRSRSSFIAHHGGMGHAGGFRGGYHGGGGHHGGGGFHGGGGRGGHGGGGRGGGTKRR
jgi:hypothetical protein